MTSLTVDAVAQYIGQTVHDIYGRKVGTLVSVYSDVDGQVTALEIMVSEKQYETVPANRFELSSEGVKMLPDWLVEAKRLAKMLDLAKKRVRALEELFRKGQIPTHAYDELKSKLTKELDKLKSEAKKLREELRKRVYELENLVLHIEKAMTHLLVSYTAGEIPEQAFRTSMDAMRLSKQAALAEKKDLERHIELLEKLEQEAAQAAKPEIKEEVKEGAPQAPSTTGPIAVKVINA